MLYILVLSSIWSYYFSKRKNPKVNLIKEFRLKRFSLLGDIFGWIFIVFFIVLFSYLFLLEFFNMVYQNFDIYIKLGASIVVFIVFAILFFVYVIKYNQENKSQLLYQTVPLTLLVVIFSLQGYLSRPWM